MDYWGGALPGSRKCECGVTGKCVDQTKWCNCDSGLDGWFEDGGDITEKQYLPVRQLRFGDTGTALDEKEGRYTLGPLICEGDGELTRNYIILEKFIIIIYDFLINCLIWEALNYLGSQWFYQR